MRRLGGNDTIVEASKKCDHGPTALQIGWSSADDDYCARETTLCRLVEHTADILTKFAEEADGITANERIKRKRYHVEVVTDRK